MNSPTSSSGAGNSSGPDPGSGSGSVPASNPWAPRTDRPGALGGGPGPEAGTPAPNPAPQLTYDGRFSEILVLFLTNVVLNILTLGFYRFWGKTRIRRYIWSRMALGGVRFEYVGTGLEIFVSFMLIFTIFYLPFLVFIFWLQLNPPGETQLAQLLWLNLVLFAFVLILFILYYVALFAAYRYRISRTLWRGIRGGMTGSPVLYGFLGGGLGILNVLSLGWTKPWADSVAFHWRMERAFFGDRKVRSRLGCGQLYPPFTVAWIVTAVLVIGVYSYIIVLVVRLAREGGPLRPQETAWLEYTNLIGYLLILLFWMLASQWYKAVFLRNLAGTSRLGEFQFRARFTMGQLFWLKVPNFLLLLVTLGLAFPYTVHRTARFISRHLEATGDPQIETLRPGAEKSPKLGDGLAEFVGFGGL